MTPSVISDPRFITLRIFEVERCWAYAMQLKEEVSEQACKRFHARNKLRKAVKLSVSLSKFLESLTFEPSTRLEVQAYVSWIHGVLQFDLQEWKLAKEYLESANTIYSGLSKSADDDFRELYLSRIEELTPQIRYCAYNIGDKDAATDLRKMLHGNDTDEQIEQLIDQARSKEAEKVTEITWLGQKIPVKLEEARLAVLALQEFDAEIKALDQSNQEAVIHHYESILKTCVTGIAAVREAMSSMDQIQSQAVGSSTGDAASIAASKRQAQATAASLSADKMSRTQLLLSFLQYSKLERTVGRGLAQVSSALSMAKTKNPLSVKEDMLGTSSYPKAQELARLYDTIVQNLSEVQSLPGAVQESPELQITLKARITAYRTFRCFYLALAHGQNKKFQESLALLSRSAKYAKLAVNELDELDAEVNAKKIPGAFACFANVSFKTLVSQLQILTSSVPSEEVNCRAEKMLFLAQGSRTTDPSTAPKSDKPLIEDLNTFYNKSELEQKVLNSKNGQPLVAMPPGYLPIPMKTTFFDLALNHVEYPSYQERVRKTVEEQSAVQSGGDKANNQGSGISGFVKGWIWGGGK
ncbi:signal recognition particle subunit srp68 [Cichlidogyrus casuarinus]|uniref:Signal recognition particle subunit SRP68 n=1 Tax=Cichlidogyrus casuarinus TaxID=1844966 RepID=A0ABD2QI11_9PLAT